MSKAPRDPKEIFQEFMDECKALFGEDLVSIVLYGSATGAGYRPGKSDINFMIILSEKGIDQLERAFKLVDKWRKRNVAVPLFLTEDYIQRSLDVFPIEYINFQRNYILVYGKDILKDLSFDREYVRLQAEREIKGKLLLLREAYLDTAGKVRRMKELIAESLGAFGPIFSALLFLKDIDVEGERRSVLKKGCDAYDIDAVLFEKLLDIREERVKTGNGEIRTLFKGYLKEVRKLAKAVDTSGG